MTDAVIFLAPAFAMCVVIASIHVYLGMHVLEREVIFVDLSLAQLAALGATTASVWGAHEERYAGHVAAIVFTLAGAAIFAFTRRVRDRVSEEAIVGIVFAVASASTVLVLSRAPHGAEHMKDILVGSLLLTTWHQVGWVLGVYAVLGAIQAALARRFIELSWHPAGHEGTLSASLWEFGFYALFGMVIAISVQVAGILLVFSFLIVPAVVTRLFSDRIGMRLAWGWAVALAASALGLGASWTWDLPTGATIVAAFGALLIVAASTRAGLVR